MAQDEGDDAAEWLSTFLGKDVRLVRYIGETQVAAEASPCSSYAVEG